MRALLLLVLSGAGALHASHDGRPIPPNEPEVHLSATGLETYPVRGATLDRIFQSIRDTGPHVWYENRNAAAMAHWKLDWDYRESRDADGCRVGAFKVTVWTKITMPEWKDRDDGRPEVRAAWDTYYARVRRHEETHLSHGVAAGNEFARRIRALGLFPDCASVSMAIARARLQVLGQFQRLDRDFDHEEGVRAARK